MTEDPKALAERVLSLKNARGQLVEDSEKCRLARAVLDYAKRATACPACMTQDRLRLERDEARAEVGRLREALSKITDVVSDGARAGMSIMRGIAEDALKGGSDG